MSMFNFTDCLSGNISTAADFAERSQLVSSNRFKMSQEIRSRDGDLGGRAIGDLFLDTNSSAGLTLFVERSVYNDGRRENGVVVEKSVCCVHSISIVLSPPQIKGMTVSEKKFRSSLKTPETKDEIEAADALFEQFRAYYTASPDRVFIDKTGRTVALRQPPAGNGMAQLALN